MGEEKRERIYEKEESAAATPTEFSSEEKATKDDDSYEKALVPLPMDKLISLSNPEKDGADNEAGKTTGKPKDRDIALAQVEMEKRLALIKAWEDNEKTKADNKAYRKLSAINSWENTKRASLEAELKQIEEKIEKKKAEYAEKMKNKMAIVHKAAEEKKALIEADRGNEFLTVEETASKFRATGGIPKKLFACFSC